MFESIKHFGSFLIRLTFLIILIIVLYYMSPYIWTEIQFIWSVVISVCKAIWDFVVHLIKMFS